jgi:golgin subfamily B member 1
MHMKERTRSLVSVLEHDPSNTAVIEELEELVSGDDIDEHLADVRFELHEGRRRLIQAGRFQAASAVMEIEVAIVESGDDEAQLLKEQARLLDEDLFDQESALRKLIRVRDLCPEDDTVAERIQFIEAERERYREIVQTFREQAESATDAALTAHMLYSAAERLFKNEPDHPEIRSLLNRAIEEDPTHPRAARLLERMLEQSEDWSALGQLYGYLATKRKGRHERLQMFLAAGYTFGHRLEDLDEAARYYAEALDYEPGQPSALRFLVKYYEDREDWDHLVALYEDTLHARLQPEEEIAACMQVGMVHWKYRKDIRMAEKYFRRLAKIDPGHPGMIDFYRKYAEETGERAVLLKVLENAARAVTDNAVAEQLTREIAQLSGVEGGNVEKAIDAWKKVLRQDKNNAEAAEQLKVLYRQSSKWNNLIDLLRTEAEGLEDADVEGKILRYEEMVDIYQNQLSLEMMVIKIYHTILKLDPDNVSAMDSLIAVYESAGRWNDLVKMLSQRSEIARKAEDKIEILQRIAALWIDQFGNYNKAIEPLEAILDIDPTRRDALEKLKEIYEKRRAWGPLMAILEKELVLQADDESRQKILMEMARLASDKLNQADLATELWWKMLAMEPENAEALSAIERLTERNKDWPGLVRVLTMMEERTEPAVEKANLLIKLGTVLKERLQEPVQAAEVWKRLLEVDPGNAKAMRSLKEAYQDAEDWESLEALYTEAGDYESLVEVLGIAADRARNPETRIFLSFRCAQIYNEIIEQPDRAVRHYERILSADEQNQEAAEALIPIYERSEKWSRLSGVLEIALNAVTDPAERIRRMNELRDLAFNRLNNRDVAFQWACRAFETAPTDLAVREILEESAVQAGSFEPLISVYRKHLDAFDDVSRRDLMKHIARMSLEKLGNSDDAVQLYREVLKETPADTTVLLALDEIFRSTGQMKNLEEVFLARIEYASDAAEKRNLMVEFARMYEEGWDDQERAAVAYRNVLEIFEGDPEALEALERIFQIGEKYSELVPILEQQLRVLTPGTEKWKEKKHQMARVHADRLDDAESAILLYQEVLEQLPGDADTIECMDAYLRNAEYQIEVARTLEPHLVATQDWRRLAWVLSILIENTPIGRERVLLNMRLADVYADQLSDERLAFETIRAALAESPDERELWDRVESIGRQMDALSDIGAAWAAAFDNDALADERRLEIAERLAVLYETELSQVDVAERFHQFIWKYRPDAGNSFSSLEQLYTSTEQWDRLLGLYHAARGCVAFDRNRLELLLKIAFVVCEVSHDVPASIAVYREILELDPQNEEANRSLIWLYEEAGRWSDLVSLLKSHLESASTAESISLRYQIGEILEQKLMNPPEAVEFFEDVLQADSDHLKSQQALERLLQDAAVRLRVARILADNYEQQGAWEPLAHVLSILLEDTDLEISERVELHIRIADIRERRISEPERAFDAMSMALTCDTDNSLVFNELSRMASEYALSARFRELLESLVDNALEPDVASRFLLAIARSCDEQQTDEEKTLRAWLALLKHDADNPETAIEAIDALDRIYQARETFEPLLEVLRQKVELLDAGVERIEILQRMADIEEGVLSRTANAVALYREIRELDETNLIALSGLERLYTAAESWKELIEILQSRVVYENDPDQRRDLLLRVGDLFESRLHQDDDAIDAYQQAIETGGSHLEALQPLERLYTRTERWPDLRDVYEAEIPLYENPEKQAELHCRIGELLRNQLNEPEESVRAYASALELDPDHSAARTALEVLVETKARVLAIEILTPIAEAEGNYEKQLHFLLIQADSNDDPVEKSELYRRAADIAENGLDRADQAFELIRNALRNGTASSELESILENTERLAQLVDGHRELLSLYREIVSDILDAALQVRCYLKIADTAYRIFEDVSVAREYFLKIMDLETDNERAMSALEEIYQHSGEYLELFEIYRQKIQNTYDDEERIRILFKQARVCEDHLEDFSSAIQSYEGILEIDESRRDAIAALERLYQREERWADLGDLLERRRTNEPDRRVELTQRLGKLVYDELGDVDHALELFSEVFAEDPEYSPTVETLESLMAVEGVRGRVAEILEPVYSQQGSFEKLATVLEAQSEACDDVMDRKILLRRMGTVYEEQLGDLEKAFGTFSRLFKEDPEDASSRDLLVRLTSVMDSWGQLSEVFSQILEDTVGDTSETAEMAFMLGEIFENRLSDPGRAKSAYRRVLAYAPDDARAFEAVERMLRATHSFPDLLALYRDAADAAMEVEKQKEYLFRIAEIHEEHMEDRSAAISVYREVLNLDERDERATNALDQLLFESEQFDELVEHFRNQILMADTAAQRNALRREMAKIQEQNLTDLSAAVDTYEEALSEPGGDSGSLAELERLILNENFQERITHILEPIYRDTDQWKKLVVILKTQVPYLDAPAEQMEKLREIAMLHETRGGNVVLAFRAHAAALAADPLDRISFDDMVRLSEGIGNWEEFAEAIRPVAEEVADPDFQKELLSCLGNLYDQKLDMPREAIAVFVRVLELDDADAEALNALEGLYNLVGDFPNLVTILAKKAELAPNPEEQSQLLRAGASIQEEFLEDREAAIGSYAEALNCDPSSTAAMLALERLYEATEKWTDLVDVQRQRMDILKDAEERRRVAASIAMVLEVRLQDVSEAIQVWDQVLAENPDDMEALLALDRLYMLDKNYSDLLDNLRCQRERIPDQAAWVDLTMRMGDLQRMELSDSSGAMESYRDVLAQIPTHTDAISRLEEMAAEESIRQDVVAILEPLHRQAERHDRLIHLLELKLEIEMDPAQKQEILYDIADVYETGKCDPLQAFETCVRALTADPTQERTIQMLERIARAEGLYSRLAQLYDSVVAELYEPEAERRILLRLGEIREGELGDLTGAVQAYRRIYDNGDSTMAILSALDRLYERLAMWTELDEILEEEIQGAVELEDGNRLKMRQAEIREREFKDYPGAISIYRDIVEVDPGHTDAVIALETLLKRDEVVTEVTEILSSVYEACGNSQKKIHLLEARLRVAQENADRIEIYQSMAVHQEQVINDLSSAFDALTQAFRLQPDDLMMISELERLAEATGSWSALVDIAEKAVAQSDIRREDKISIGLKIASWAFHQVGDPRKAEVLYQAVLDQDPEHQEALEALVNLLKGLGRFEDLLPVLQKQADVVYDIEAKKRILTDAAQMARSELSDVQRSIGFYQQILDNDDSDIDVLDAMIALTEETAEFPRMVDLLLTRAQFTSDPQAGNAFRHRAAVLFSGPLSNRDRAIELYREILEVDPSDDNARQMLETIFENDGMWIELLDVCQNRLEMASDSEQQVEILRKMASICDDRMKDDDEAILKYQDIRMHLPEDRSAREGLERIFVRTERFTDLVELLEEEARQAEDKGDRDTEMTVLVKIGEICVSRLDDFARATEIYERVLEFDPEHTRALSALSRLYESNGEWDRVAEVLHRAAASARGGQDEAEVHYRLALLYETHMEDPEQAFESLKKAVSLYPDHLEANQKLSAYYRERGDTGGLLETLIREERNLTADPERIGKLIDIAAIQKNELSNPQGAVTALETAYQLDKSNTEVLLMLSDALIDAGRQDDAIPVMENLIAAETHDGKRRSKAAASYYQKLARAFMAKNDLDTALTHLEAAYRMDISNTDVLVTLGKLRFERNELDEAAKLFRALLLQKFDRAGGLTKSDIYCYVGDIQFQQGDPRKAKSMYQRGLDEDRNHVGCRAGLEKC